MAEQLINGEARAEEAREEATAPVVELFELSDEEFAAHEQRITAVPALAEQQRTERMMRIEALLQKYPLAPGQKTWRHQDVGERAYIEIAINGGYFDPMLMRAEYRPDLEPPRPASSAPRAFIRA